MPILTCRRVVFHSEQDEKTFFNFASGIAAVRRVEGTGDAILLHVKARPSQQALRDLIALFQRCRIAGMSQLACFATAANADWFAADKASWRRQVFPKFSDP